MKLSELLTVAGLAVLLGSGWARAQDSSDNADDEGELTITLIPDPEADLPEAVTKELSLPLPNASDTGNEQSADGRAIADQRHERREAGLDTAAQARELGREFGENMSEAAEEARENFARGNVPEDLPIPETLPELPEPPDPPGPPGT